MKISCLIADDEPMALQLLESYVLRTPFLDLKAKCSSAIAAMQVIDNQPDIQLYFLDIQMPELSGLEFSKTLRKSSRVIFTTAFDGYALEGYKVNASGYLLKPFDYNEFLEAVQKVKLQLEEAVPQNSIQKKPDFFFVKSEYRQVKIKFSDIEYIEGLKDYVKIYLQDTPKPVLTLMSLKKLEEELPAENFMRIHRSYIIALDKIDSVERNQVIIGGKEITIAPNYKDELSRYISGKSL